MSLWFKIPSKFVKSSLIWMKVGFISASCICIFCLCRHIYYETFTAGRSRQNTRSYRSFTFHYQCAALGGSPQPVPQLTQSHSYFFNQISAPVPHDKPRWCCSQNLLSEGHALDDSHHVSFICQFLLSIIVRTLSQVSASSLFMMSQQMSRQHPNEKLWTAALEVTVDLRESGMSHCWQEPRGEGQGWNSSV